MMRPASLIRGDEPSTPRIEANANNISKGKSSMKKKNICKALKVYLFFYKINPIESIDCGILAIGCCNTHGCQRMGTSKAFLIILVLVGIIQGAIERYFWLSAQSAALQFGYDTVIVRRFFCISLFRNYF